MALGQVCALGMEGVLPIGHGAHAAQPRKDMLIQEVLLASGYDGCLQVLGEIPKSKTLTCSDREAFMKEWGSDL